MAQSNTPEQLRRRWDRLAKMPAADLIKEVIASGIELSMYERRLCASVVANQSDPNTELPRILAAYGEVEAWRYVAHPAQERLFDGLVELERRTGADDKTTAQPMQMSFGFEDTLQNGTEPL